jgi:hypothetical protein
MARLHLEPENWEEYVAGVVEGGRPPSAARFGGSVHAFLSEDPERTASLMAEQLSYHTKSYADAAIEGTGARSVDDAPASATPGLFNTSIEVVTPEGAVDMIDEVVGDRTVDTVYLHATVAGVIDDLVYENVRLIATRFRGLVG